MKQKNTQLNKVHGFTLLELLFVSTTIFILLSLGMSSFFSLLQQQKVIVEFNRLAGMLNHARTLSIQSGQAITVCGSQDQVHCDGSWNQQYIAFFDANNNLQVDTPIEFVLQTKTPKADVFDIRWSAFGRQQYLKFLPTGITAHHNGTFTLCHKNNKYSRALSITKSGRIRKSRDSNGDGIHEIHLGRAIKCNSPSH
ncbi:MAG: GspH/FimT family pseudopilin [Gammaproteobacteria bacterium]|nr:GspH/FimT family pseudopilin [Gammaproteobacteria bacterium]